MNDLLVIRGKPTEEDLKAIALALKSLDRPVRSAVGGWGAPVTRMTPSPNRGRSWGRAPF
ncbi:hypothetical protein [Amycolatopsis sp. NPDC051071]|uniref:hypothetical protein n=1 Tax=Amycolatopsis sp. NPDC051071 TaxID=3154637 RepID=UPI0034483305